MEALLRLKDAVANSRDISLLRNDEKTLLIKEATHVALGDDKFPLDAETDFLNEDKPQLLRAVVFCWMHDKSLIVDYKTACLEQGVPDFKFLVKSELTLWLQGKLDTCQFLKESDAGGPKKRQLNPQVQRIAAFEEESVNHNAVLRGSKNIVFRNLISDAKRFSSQLKRAKVAERSVASAGNHKQPIIIVSPATTALLSLGNIKEFLEEGRFVEPSVQAKRPESGVISVHRASERLVTAAHTIMVVDNVDMFTKPEYWDRVVAIFTTGQAWQFAKYKYQRPEVLFQKYAGFYMAYLGDVVPKHITDWNVNVVRVDRGEKRFRDKMIVRDLWIQLERLLVAKGYGA